MNNKRHGLSIGIEGIGEDFFLILKATGTLTHKDYEIITPIIDSAYKSFDRRYRIRRLGIKSSMG